MKIFIIATLLLTSNFAHAEGDSVVVNIFTNRPEQRAQSRWTLADWMKTKERISMMDMWLAHHSGKSMLPELALSGFYTFSHNQLTPANSSTSSTISSNYYIANMDFYFLPLKFADFGIFATAKSIAGPWSGFNDSAYNLGTLFRIFGTNIQNSFIVIKLAYAYNEMKVDAFGMDKRFFTGLNVGTDLQLYIVDIIGIHTGINWMPKTAAKNNAPASLSYISYNVKLFLEYKVLRFEGGYYQEFNTLYLSDGENKIKTSGWLAGAQIDF